MKIVKTTGAPEAIGPYSQGVVAGDLLFTAGQIPLDPDTNEMVEDEIHEQVSQVMLNLANVLAAAGADFSNVVKATVYLKDLNHFAAMNTVYAEFMGDNKPARACIQAAKLPFDCMVEIDMIAKVNREHF